jgi:hypothetical protein
MLWIDTSVWINALVERVYAIAEDSRSWGWAA